MFDWIRGFPTNEDGIVEIRDDIRWREPGQDLASILPGVDVPREPGFRLPEKRRGRCEIDEPAPLGPPAGRPAGNTDCLGIITDQGVPKI